MTQMLKSVRRRKPLTAAQEERLQLLESMTRTRVELNQAYAQFNAQSDPDLIESCVFTINALRSRYSYFIRRMKLLDAGEAEVG